MFNRLLMVMLVWLAVAAPAAAQPDNLYPGTGATSVSTNPPLQISCDEAALAGQYQIAANSAFSNIVYDSGTQQAAICNHVALAGLGRGATYYWRARVQGSDGTWSSWSSATSFATVGAGVRVGRLELRDGVQGYAGNADADIRGSFADPTTAIREWNQGLQDILRTGRRPAGSSTDEIYRTLVKFDLTQVTPATPVISAYFELTGEGTHSDTTDFRQPSRAHRVLVPWSEWNPDGADDSCCGPVESGEVSWTFRSNPAAWDEPGAAGIETDRSFASLFVTRFRNLLGDVTRSSGEDLLPLVQLWIDDPAENHGIALVSTNESRQRVMNWASSDHANPALRPALIAELVVTELIDLEVSLPAPAGQPVIGEVFDLPVVLRNTGPDAASGVAVRVTVPAGYSLVSHSATAGGFNAGTGVWSVANLGAGQTATLTLTGSHTASTLEVAAAVIAADQLDADSYPDNFRDEDDNAERVVSLSASGGGGGSTTSFNFDGNASGFTYLDDLFRGTSQPTYAQGSYSASGGFSGGGLVVTLGGVNNNTIANMSGGWRYGFSLASAATVTVSFRYRLTDSGTYEGDECTELLAAVNGALMPSGAAIDQICGNDPQSNVPEDTGWQQTSFQVALGAGNHTLDLGGYNNLKTRVNEQSQISLDDVSITVGGGGDPVADTLVVTPASLSLDVTAGSSVNGALQVSTAQDAQVAVSFSDDAAWLGSIAGGTTPVSRHRDGRCRVADGGAVHGDGDGLGIGLRRRAGARHPQRHQPGPRWPGTAGDRFRQQRLRVRLSGRSVPRHQPADLRAGQLQRQRRLLRRWSGGDARRREQQHHCQHVRRLALRLFAGQRGDGDGVVPLPAHRLGHLRGRRVHRAAGGGERRAHAERRGHRPDLR
jgi:uncharacterized repeat protein (TIGR01451 family)